MMIFSFLVIAGFALYVLKPAERARLVEWLARHLERARQAALQRRNAPDPFHDALVQRTRLVILTPALLAVNAAVFLAMIPSPGPVGAPETLLAWGGNFGPRTTQGEWWRLLSAPFVHAGFFSLVFTALGLAQPGRILERLVGPLSFALVYGSAALVGGLVRLASDPIAVSVGAGDAVFGVYGLLLATLAWGLVRRSPLVLPLQTLKAMAPAGGLFLLYHLAGGLGVAEIAALASGLVYGVALAPRLGESKPPLRLLAGAAAATVVFVTAGAIPLRGLSDVRPELERIKAVETRTSDIYAKAVGQFRLGAINAKALAQIIDRRIVPEVRAAHARLKAIEGVPAQHQTLVARADEYLRLREQSWRQRSEALHAANMTALRTADRTERASLEAFERLGER